MKSRVDYESVQEVNFKVVVYDTGIPQMSASALVTAKIININDNDPMFEKVSADFMHKKLNSIHEENTMLQMYSEKFI